MKNYLVESMTSLYGNLNEAISGWNEDEYLHFAFRCQNCPALVAGDNDEWVCDEVGKPCSQVVECPEGLGILVDESLKEARNPEDEHDNCTFSMNPTIKKLVDDGNFSELVKYNTIYDIPPEYAKKLKKMCSENGYHCSVNRGGKNYWIKISDKKSNLEESSALKEDYNPQLQSDVYNALADIMFKYYNKGIKVTPEQVQQAFEWFDVHFWADEDLDEACNSEPKEELKEDINTPFIKIYKEGQVAEDGWDYPVAELDYLLEEHPGESFVLKDDRLYEMTDDSNESTEKYSVACTLITAQNRIEKESLGPYSKEQAEKIAKEKEDEGYDEVQILPY